MDSPTFAQAAKMFDLSDAYLCSLRPYDGWTYKDAVHFIQEHWNDDEFNIDYEHLEE